MRDVQLYLSRFSDWVNACIIAVCAGLLAMMLVISALGVGVDLAASLINRLGGSDFLASQAWGWLYANTRPSVVRIFLPWLGMLSITVAFKYGEHIAIDLFSHRLPGPALMTVKAINFIAIALFGLLLLRHGFELFMLSSRQMIVSGSLALSQRWTVAAVPLAGLVICIHLVDGFRLLEERNAAREEPDDGATEESHPPQQSEARP